jgi:hypothetical protein
MKKNKEMISLNSISTEFNNEMGVNERFEILDKSMSQKIKGGVTCDPMTCGMTDDPSCQLQLECGNFDVQGWIDDMCPSMT